MAPPGASSRYVAESAPEVHNQHVVEVNGQRCPEHPPLGEVALELRPNTGERLVAAPTNRFRGLLPRLRFHFV